MQKNAGHKMKNVPNSNIRFLYRLITFGIGGLAANEQYNKER
jgi:hypothetical protein